MIRYEGTPHDEAYTKVPNILFRTPTLKSRAVHVMGNLLSHDSRFNVTVQIIADQTGLAPNTVTAALDDLVAHGLIEREAVPGKRGQFDRNDYIVNFDRLAAMTYADAARRAEKRAEQGKQGRHAKSDDSEAPIAKSATGPIAKSATGPVANIATDRRTYIKNQGENASAHASEADDTPPWDAAESTPLEDQQADDSAAAQPPAHAAPVVGIIEQAVTDADDRADNLDTEEPPRDLDDLAARHAADGFPRPDHCDEHAYVAYVADPCPACKAKRLANERARDLAAEQERQNSEMQRRRLARLRAGRTTCRTCDHNGRRVSINPATGLETEIICEHTDHDAQDAAAAREHTATTSTTTSTTTGDNTWADYIAARRRDQRTAALATA